MSVKRRKLSSRKNRSPTIQVPRTRVSRATGERSNSVSLFKNKWPKGTPRGGPPDRYIFTIDAWLNQVNANEADNIFMEFGLNAVPVATMLSNIRLESPYTLLGGAVLLQPTLFVRCLSVATIVNAGNSAILGSYVVAKSRVTVTSTISGVSTEYSTQFANNWDAVPTGYENYPSNKIGINKAFFGTGNVGLGRYRKGKEVQFRILPGQTYNIREAFSAKVEYQDYALSGWLASVSGGFLKNRSRLLIVRIRGEEGQVCGLDGALAATPVLAPVPAVSLIRTRHYYQYKWAGGNNRPTVYGSNLGADESVPATAHGFIGIPGIKAQRYAAGAAANAFGALDYTAHQEAQLNFGATCAESGSNYFQPTVTADPP